MIVGYMSKFCEQENQVLLDYGVNHVVIRESSLNEGEAFTKFLKEFQEHELVIAALSSIGETMTNIQLLENYKWLRSQGKSLHVLNMGIGEVISSKTYQDILIQIAEFDKEAIIKRTKLGIQQARLEGRMAGRPKLDQETVRRLRYLHESKKMTIRQIADNCKVSIGTVWKYIQ